MELACKCTLLLNFQYSNISLINKNITKCIQTYGCILKTRNDNKYIKNEYRFTKNVLKNKIVPSTTLSQSWHGRENHLLIVSGLEHKTVLN